MDNLLGHGFTTLTLLEGWLTLPPLCPTDYPAGVARVHRVVDNPAIAVHVLPLACCSAEVAAAVEAGLLIPERAEDEHPRLHVLLVSGTVSMAMAPDVAAAWHDLPEPRAAVAFGACATSGGPYWDSPSVLPGVDGVVPVSAFVPGCPPRPQALLAVLHRVAGQVPA